MLAMSDPFNFIIPLPGLGADPDPLDLSPAGVRLYKMTHYPVHIRRDIEYVGNSTTAVEIVHLALIPFIYALKDRFNIPWIAHVCEQGLHVTWEHLVLPTLVWEEHRELLQQAGFTEQPDIREFACADGLKDALIGGANINQKWY
jgi:hypothetical protein